MLVGKLELCRCAMPPACSRLYQYEQQLAIVEKIAGKIVEDGQPYRMVIVDSVMNLFRRPAGDVM